MRRPGGIRITEERELLGLRVCLQQYPRAVETILCAAQELRRPVQALSLEDLEQVAVRER
jgi:hypothetical protein